MAALNPTSIPMGNWQLSNDLQQDMFFLGWTLVTQLVDWRVVEKLTWKTYSKHLQENPRMAPFFTSLFLHLDVLEKWLLEHFLPIVGFLPGAEWRIQKRRSAPGHDLLPPSWWFWFVKKWPLNLWKFHLEKWSRNVLVTGASAIPVDLWSNY